MGGAEGTKLDLDFMEMERVSFNWFFNDQGMVNLKFKLF
jgi:hypothetical protein